MEINEYAALVEAMRQAQINYFACTREMPTVKADWLKKSKALEKEVDAATVEILHPPKSTQGTIFG